VFEALLREAPEYRMDPYVHPPAVCAWVEVLRGEARARSVASMARPLTPDGPPVSQAREASTAVALPRTFPVAALVPGGVHLFRAGRPWAGATLASVQLGGLAVSVVTRARIDDAFATRSDDPDTVARWVWINRGAATAAWLAWGVPAVVELARWSGTAGGTRIGAGPSGVRVDGTF
jgi:hypothetical protein